MRGLGCVPRQPSACPAAGASAAAVDGSPAPVVLGHRRLPGRPPGQPLPPHAPGGVRADLRAAAARRSASAAAAARPTSAEEFNCQLDQLSTRPTSRSRRTSSTAAPGRAPAPTARNPAAGPTAARGGSATSRSSASRARAFGVSLHFWGGLSRRRAVPARERPPGRQPAGLLPRRRLLGRRPPMGVAEFMESDAPGDWEVVAKALPEPRAGHDDPRASSAGPTPPTSATCRSASTG